MTLQRLQSTTAPKETGGTRVHEHARRTQCVCVRARAYLDKEEGDSIGPQRPAELDVPEPGVDLT